MVVEECELSKGLVVLCELFCEIFDGYCMLFWVNIGLFVDVVCV